MPGKNKIVAISTKLETTRPTTLHVLIPSACSPAEVNCHPEFDLPALSPVPATVSSSSLLHVGCSDNLFDQIKVKSEIVIKVNHEIEKM
jgi:hypothetical protein